MGIIRGFAPFVTNIQYSVDDMTGPPLNVKQWVNAEASSINRLCSQLLLKMSTANCAVVVNNQFQTSQDCALMTSASPGTYVKVTGSLHNFSVSNTNKGFTDNVL